MQRCTHVKYITDHPNHHFVSLFLLVLYWDRLGVVEEIVVVPLLLDLNEVTRIFFIVVKEIKGQGLVPTAVGSVIVDAIEVTICRKRRKMPK